MQKDMYNRLLFSLTPQTHQTHLGIYSLCRDVQMGYFNLLLMGICCYCPVPQVIFLYPAMTFLNNYFEPCLNEIVVNDMNSIQLARK